MANQLSDDDVLVSWMNDDCMIEEQAEEEMVMALYENGIETF